MKFKIRNYCAVKHADINTSKLTLIGGKHRAGKSSTLDAIRSVLTANPMPFKDIKKAEISMLVHSGTPSGYCVVEDGDNSARIDWPKCEYVTKGKVSTLSTIAVGIDSLVFMKPAERINYIVDMMKAAPTKEDLLRELLDMGIISIGHVLPASEEKHPLFIKLWENIEMNGWDNTHQQCKEKGVKLKAKWEIVTGVRKYGVRIAEQWKPEAWSLDLDGLEEVILITDVNKAKEWVDAAKKDVAISDYEIERLKAITANKDKVIDKYDVLVKKQGVCERAMNEKKAKLRLLNNTKEVRDLVCPKCQEFLTFTNGKLKIVPKKEHEKAVESKGEAEQLRKDIASLEAQNNIQIKEWSQEKASLKIIRDADEKLKIIESQENDTGTAKVEDVENQLKKAEDRLGAFRTCKEALKIASDIINNKKLGDMLAPNGLRNTKLIGALDVINKSMKMLTDKVGWDAVEIEPGCSISVGGIPYGRFNAKSERYRARVLLQLMVAMAEHAKLVVIDDSDELVKTTKNSLMKVILQSKISAIVVSALDNRSELPDLSKIDGLSYWIENGEIKGEG
ncbi:MAG: hypothetical protein KAI70_00595 [Candidatus Omnitrophica bacterium]|nr:hypothetical protein [Candidatus Omnitrophota bacterium]